MITREEDDVVVADCRLLNIVTQGDNIEDAKKNLVEAVGLFLGTCIELDTFSQVIKPVVNPEISPFRILLFNSALLLNLCNFFIQHLVVITGCHSGLSSCCPRGNSCNQTNWYD